MIGEAEMREYDEAKAEAESTPEKVIEGAVKIELFHGPYQVPTSAELVGRAVVSALDRAGYEIRPKHTEHEMKVLEVLGWGFEELCYDFGQICDITKLTREEVRGACRSLRTKGLAYYERGLWCEQTDQPAGSGYGATKEGMELLRSRGIA